jgi:ATP-binding cassette subfamily F protein 3
MLRDDQSPLWHLAKIAPNVREQELRNFLGGFNFPGDMATGPIEHFSGGEKARLALALIVWQRPNLLLLDEPTNHLDLETREALTVALAQFEGTLVLVSHDRHLLRATTDQFMIVAGGRLQPFDGDLDDYKEWLLKSKNEAVEQKKPAGKEPPSPRERKPVNKKPIEARIKRLEEQITKLNAKKAAIDAQLADPSVYQDRKRTEPILLDQAHVAGELAQLESEWLEKQDELERAGEQG